MSDNSVKNNKFVSAVIVSAGNSSRMGGVNKQFLEINNIPVIAHTIKVFDDSNLINEIVVVTRECDIDNIKNLISYYNFKKVSPPLTTVETFLKL